MEISSPFRRRTTREEACCDVVLKSLVGGADEGDVQPEPGTSLDHSFDAESPHRLRLDTVLDGQDGVDELAPFEKLSAIFQRLRREAREELIFLAAVFVVFARRGAGVTVVATTCVHKLSVTG